jgi:hypothetical protein
MKRLFFCFLFITPLFAFSQVKYGGYTWNTFPTNTLNDTVKSVNGSAFLLERDIKEVYLNKEDIFEELIVRHRKVRVDNTSAINQNNKIYIPTSDVIDILSIQARFISPTGKITELKKGNIKQVENLENKGDYSTFAIEGAEAGGQIEYFYILKKRLRISGTNTKQDDRPHANVDVIFCYPSKIEFFIKSYNGFPQFVTQNDSSEVVEQRASTAYIPALAAEKYAFYEANLQRYEYTMSYNFFKSMVRAYSWNKVGTRFYEIFYTPAKKEVNAVNDWLETIKSDPKDYESFIREVESRIKSEIASPESFDEILSLDLVLKSKQATKHDLMRLYIAIFTQAGTRFNFVCSSDREKHPFDPDFNGWNYMDDYLLYFPKQDKYIIPDDETLRYGPPPSKYQENYGIFFQPVSMGEKLKTLGYEIKLIPRVELTLITDSLLVLIQADPVKVRLNAQTHRTFSPEVAGVFQAWWHLWDDNRKKEIVKSIFDMSDPNINILNYQVKHNSPSDIGLFPMIWEVKASSDALIETAGEDLVVKIGECIGAQSELYQTGPRKLPIAITQLHSYYRRLELEIPAGYKAADFSALKMNVLMLNNGRESCYFKSDAVLLGNKLIVTSEEKYTETYYPKERFEEFRQVINAAADFNKRTVLLVKE